MRFALQGLLEKKYLKHFEILSSAVYTLLKHSISQEEIDDAAEKLIKFADDFETLYGEEAVTMNVHMVRHYRECVTEVGPLWSYSMFGFEKNLGNLKKAVTNPTDALETISFDYCMARKVIDAQKRRDREPEENNAKSKNVSGRNRRIEGIFRNEIQ